MSVGSPANVEPPNYEILVCTGQRAGSSVSIPDGGLVLGRGEDATLNLPDSSVSSRHAVLRFEEGRLRIQDLGSRNGTLVGGRQVQSEILDDGDLVVVGSTVLQVLRADSFDIDLAESTREMEAAPLLARIVGSSVKPERRGRVLSDLYHLGLATTAGEPPQQVLEHGLRLFRDGLGCATARGALVIDGVVQATSAAEPDPLLEAAAEASNAIVRTGGARSGPAVLAALVVEGRKVVGAVVGRRAPGGDVFDEIDLALADALTVHVGQAVHRARCREQLDVEREGLVEDLSTASRELGEAREYLRSASQQLLQSERLAAIARHAAGVAHEVANPLSFVEANLDLLSSRLASRLDEEEKDMLADCRDGVRRIAAVVSKLRLLHDLRKRTTERFVLRELGEEVLGLALGEFPEGIEVVRRIEGVGVIAGDRAAITQVLLLLLFNARDATLERSMNARVSIEVTDVPNGVRLAVTGQGRTLTEQQRQTLFEPFRDGTVKDPTGLGLWMCDQIIGDHGGTFTCEVPEEGGSRLVAVIPTADEAS